MKRNLIFTLALLTMASCSGVIKKAQVQEEETVPSVKVVTAEKKMVPQDQTYSSTVQANIVNNIVPQSGARIRKINVEVGDFVKEGQVLAEMDRLQLVQAELRLKNQETELNRIKSLYEKGGVSQSDYESAVLAYNVSETTYRNLEENTILRSPISGVVTARNYDRGDMYSMASPIFTVQQITPVKLLVGVSETDFTRVKRGDKVLITVDAIPGKEFYGNVIRLYPVMDPGSHTFNVEIQVKNENREVRPGMYARVRITFTENNSIVVPDSAIMKLQGSGQRSVYILKEDNTVALRVVTLGRHDGAEYEILSGIEEGEKVVVKGQTALKSGIKVEVVE